MNPLDTDSNSKSIIKFSHFQNDIKSSIRSSNLKVKMTEEMELKMKEERK